MKASSLIQTVSPVENAKAVGLCGGEDGLYERHLLFDHAIQRTAADSRVRLLARPLASNVSHLLQSRESRA